MKNDNNEALYKSLKLTRNLTNISFLIIFLILLFWGNYNPAGVFAMIFYNAFHWLLLFNRKKDATKKTAGVVSSCDLIELAILRITVPVGILLHLLLGYGFMYKLTIKIAELKTLPFTLIIFIILFRYISYFYIKNKPGRKNILNFNSPCLRFSSPPPL